MAVSAPDSDGTGGALLDTRAARHIVDDALSRFFDGRRERVGPFVDRHFTLAGSVRLHRHAVGWDIVRAPANVALALPTVALKLSGMAARRAGAARAGHWLESRNLLLRTAVDREIEWLIYCELLELPFAADGRTATRDALAEEMLRDPRLAGALAAPMAEIARHAGDPALEQRIGDILATYAGTRAAAADLVGALANAGVGALAFHQLTPSALSLGPLLATLLTHHAAVSSFPLGATIGGLWYGMFPVASASLALAGATGALAAATAVVAAFAGIAADPVQRRLGLHRRRLNRMLDVLEQNFRGQGPSAFVVRDHYAGRLIDLVDVLRLVHRGLTRV